MKLYALQRFLSSLFRSSLYGNSSFSFSIVASLINPLLVWQTSLSTKTFSNISINLSLKAVVIGLLLLSSLPPLCGSLSQQKLPQLGHCLGCSTLLFQVQPHRLHSNLFLFSVIFSPLNYQVILIYYYHELNT